MIGKKKVIVEYDNIVSDDKKQPLVEITNIFNVRPVPAPHGFSIYEEVDAFCNNGWWLSSIKNKESIPLGNSYNTTLVIRDKDPSIEPEMEPLVKASPPNKFSFFPLSLIPPKGLELDEENSICILIKAIYGPKKPSTKHERSSQMDPLVIKEGPKRAKKGENNGKTSLVTSSSEIKPRRNIEEAKVETKEFEERKADVGGDNVSTCMVSPGTRKPEEKNNSRKHGKRSQLDMPDITPTKVDAKKAKKGKDNENIGMVAQSSEANPCQNNKKVKIKIKYHMLKKAKKGEDNGSTCMATVCSETLERKRLNGIKCDEIYVSIPHYKGFKENKSFEFLNYTLYLQGDHKWANEIFLHRL
ncbi:hypothetical protein AMTRI_Chr12g237940 [Amborella trichopoda]